MVDYSTAEIGAIGEQFPAATIYISDIHKIQASKCKLYEKVKDYTENTWLSCLSHWAHAFWH